MRIHLTNEVKVQIAQESMLPGATLRGVAKRRGVTASQIKKWRENLAALVVSSSKKSLHKGPVQKGKDEEQIVLDLLAQGEIESHAVQYKDIVLKVLCENSLFLLQDGEQSGSKQHFKRVYEWCRRITDKNQYTIRKPTHLAQNAADNVIEFGEFVDSVKQLAVLFDISPERIVNMDQTAIDFDPQPKKALRRKGVKTVRVKKVKAKHGERCTGLLSVAANGHKLPALYVFKGNRFKHIHKRECPEHNRKAPNLGLFTIQSKHY